MSLAVKVCGNTSFDNISKIINSSYRPDYLGFIISEQSPRGISPSAIKELIKGLSPNIKTALVIVDTNIEELKQTLLTINDSSHRLSAIQLHGGQDSEFILSSRKFFSGELIKVFPVTEGFDFEQCEEFKDLADYFLFDTGGTSAKLGGTGLSFDWNLLDAYKCGVPYFLAGGISPEDTTKLRQLSVSQPFLYGVDINSRFEISPGIKDPVLVSNFIKEIRS